MDTEFKIRSITAADLERIEEIDGELVGPNRASSWSLTAEANWWVKRPMLNFVAEVDGVVEGFLLGDIRAVEFNTNKSGWIDVIGISLKYQGSGIGKKLVEAFCEECQKNGVKARTVIREDDKKLSAFWTAVGFHRGSLIDYER
ncbi:MAG: GNAT family N-acetyltransferase [Dehalococcoidia bacterium]|nr:GNAT family N-acetyltransferase [Dehalococcoidia bacterium]